MLKKATIIPKPKFANKVVKEQCPNLEILSMFTGICENKIKSILVGKTALDYSTACLISRFFGLTPDELFYDDYYCQLDLKMNNRKK